MISKGFFFFFFLFFFLFLQSGAVFWVTIYVNYILILSSAYIKMSNLGAMKGLEKPKLGKLNNAKELKETEIEFKN